MLSVIQNARWAILMLVLNFTCGYSKQQQRLLVIVLDGFRYDYVDRPDLSGGLSGLRSLGTFAHHIVPVFPSLTYPNLNSLITGQYPENHGFVANVMYDPTHKTTFYQADREEGPQPYWWNVSIPIWATAEANNISTGLYGWPICNIKISDQMPHYCTKHAENQEMAMAEKYLNDILIRFQEDQLQLAMLYIEHADTMGHEAGPDSDKLGSTLNTIDQLFVGLIRRIADDNITDINIIVTSSHGMAEMSTNSSKLLHIDKYVSMDDVLMVNDYGAFVGVYPEVAHFAQVYKELKQMEAVGGVTVYKQSEIPSRYHIKISDRTAPIVVIANPGYYLFQILNNEKQKPSLIDVEIYTNIGKGAHGYDPALVPEMNGIFLLYGPAFNKNYNADEIRMVDVYNLMTCVLDIEGHPNNGSWSTICPFLKDSCNGFCKSSNNKNSASSLSLPIFTLLITAICSHKYNIFPLY